MPKTFITKEVAMPIVDLICQAGLAVNKGFAKRMILNSEVKIDNELRTQLQDEIVLRDGMVLEAANEVRMVVKE